MDFLADVAWSFSGWLRRGGLNWTSARFAADSLESYWTHPARQARGGRFRLDAQELGHLDSKYHVHHDAHMRTTVTLDEDVERLLRDAMHRSRCGFKEAVNAAVRAGLGRNLGRSRRAPFVVKARPMGLRPGLDPAGFNKLTDELEVEAFLAKGRGPNTR